jgi:hypothetical protein
MVELSVYTHGIPLLATLMSVYALFYYLNQNKSRDDVLLLAILLIIIPAITGIRVAFGEPYVKYAYSLLYILMVTGPFWGGFGLLCATFSPWLSYNTPIPGGIWTRIGGIAILGAAIAFLGLLGFTSYQLLGEQSISLTTAVIRVTLYTILFGIMMYVPFVGEYAPIPTADR